MANEFELTVDIPHFDPLEPFESQIRFTHSADIKNCESVEILGYSVYGVRSVDDDDIQSKPPLDPYCIVTTNIRTITQSFINSDSFPQSFVLPLLTGNQIINLRTPILLTSSRFTTYAQRFDISEFIVNVKRPSIRNPAAAINPSYPQIQRLTFRMRVVCGNSSALMPSKLNADMSESAATALSDLRTEYNAEYETQRRNAAIQFRPRI